MPASPEPQLSLPLEPDAVVVATERFTQALSGREDRVYVSPAHPRGEARLLAALLLDRGEIADGNGPWQRAIAGGVRTVELRDAPQD